MISLKTFLTMKTRVNSLVAIAFFSAGVANDAAAQMQIKAGARYFMDVHTLEPGGVRYADVANAHTLDLQIQDKYGVAFIAYWVDEEGGQVYCLSKAGEAADIHTTHAHAHGLLPDAIYEVIAGEQAAYTGNGSLFLDIHDLGPGNVTAAAVEEAHLKDLAIEKQYNVHFINYWVDEKNGKVFCLSESPNKDAVIKTHTHAHGLVPQSVMLVKQGQ
jgi:hypothetical protein